MELQALLVLCGVGVASAAMLLLMGLFSTSGTSYEEAIAQQRRATTELLALADNKGKPKKSNKKANKKLAKKEKKESTSAATASDPESETHAESGVDEDVSPESKHHVDFSPPVVVEVSKDSPPNVKIRKRGKDPKVKPILVNKEDPSCVSEASTQAGLQSATVSNHFEELHPKDEFELLHASIAGDKAAEKKEEIIDKKEVKPLKQAKAKREAVKPAPIEPSRDEPGRERHNSGDAPKEQRKPKKLERKSEEDVREEIVPPLNAPQPSELTTDKLLKAAPAPLAPAPSPPATKNKKKKPEPNVLSLMAAGDGGGVNVGELVRVVREAALSRTEIQILTDALLNKHHDPLPEHSEWSEGPNDPIQKLKKQLADKEKALADEIEASQAIHAKLKELRATLNAERGRAAGAARAAEAAAAAARAELHTQQARLQRLLDDNHALAQDKHLLQSKLSAEAEVQAQRVQMEMHIQRLSESEAALLQQLSALQAESGARALDAAQARCEAGVAQQHAADAAQQLQEANRAYSELDQERQRLVHKEQMARQELRQAQDRLNDLQNEVQRLTSRAQAAEGNADTLKEELEKQKQQSSSELMSLREQLSARESELAEVKQLKAAPAQNGLSPLNEQLKTAELAKVESVVESLRGELASAQKSSREQQLLLSRLQDQLAQYKDKNNELRTKNWKVMEALQSAEKSLQTKSASALPAQDALRDAMAKSEESHYTEVANILRAACPSLAPSSGSGREWLRAFADEVRSHLAKKEQVKVVEKVAVAPDSRVSGLQAQNEHLQGLVDKYKKVIEDTEGVLGRLQQNVSTEEQRWGQQLADKQRELDDLRLRTLSQMQKKIDTLTAELQQAKSSNHSHSFADAERLTEERLMGGLSEKHSVDACNGPLQVGLENK